MKPNNALTYIRQLCCLGLGKEAVIPELLRSVKAVIPSDSNVFVGLDENQFPAYAIPEYFVPEALEVYTTETERLHHPELIRRIFRWFENHAVLDDPRILADDFYDSDYYHLVWKPCNQYHAIQGIVGNMEGMLFLCRPKTQRPFGNSEKEIFTHLLAYVTHGLSARRNIEVEFIGESQSGMMILDASGKVNYISESAKKLLNLANGPLYPTREAFRTLGQKPEIPAAIQQICRNLDGIFKGRQAIPPMFTHVNHSGRFTFRAYWLDRQNGEPGGLIGVTIEHQEPLTLHILRQLKDWPLSTSQREVCLLLAQSRSQEYIAGHLHIKLSTVKDHVRKVYDKLDIHSREELLPRLSGQALDIHSREELPPRLSGQADALSPLSACDRRSKQASTLHA
ncbi:MAG: helix-turn-helix transcriptional regulator [Candidatus Methylumidiphilus sp.]